MSGGIGLQHAKIPCCSLKKNNFIQKINFHLIQIPWKKFTDFQQKIVWQNITKTKLKYFFSKKNPKYTLYFHLHYVQ